MCFLLVSEIKINNVLTCSLRMFLQRHIMHLVGLKFCNV